MRNLRAYKNNIRLSKPSIYTLMASLDIAGKIAATKGHETP